MTALEKAVHERLVRAAKLFKRAESELLEAVQKAESLKLFRCFGYSSLFSYVVGELGLSENVAFMVINVGRKAEQVPELKQAIQQGELSLSKAKKITSVITAANQAEWLK